MRHARLGRSWGLVDESHLSGVGDEGDWGCGGGVESCRPIDDECFSDEVVSGDNSGAECLVVSDALG